MKLILIFFLSATFAAQCEYVRSDQSKRDEALQAALWESNLNKAKSLDADSKFKALQLGLRNMGFRASTRSHSPAIDEIFRKIQHEYLSTPGHAQFFVDEIERARSLLGTKDEPAGNFDYLRCDIVEQTLTHLPSPEIVKVLGNYLSDERDFSPPRAVLGKLVNGAYVDSEYLSRIPGNSHLACSSLSMMGLRNTGLRPASESAFVKDEDLANARAWWEEIKSGKRTFSFIGQAVEYRFKPDGTWETIPISNPPDDGPKPAPEITSDRPNKKSTTAKTDSPKTSRDSIWWWIGIGGFVLLAAIGWLWRKTQT